MTSISNRISSNLIEEEYKYIKKLDKEIELGESEYLIPEKLLENQNEIISGVIKPLEIYQAKRLDYIVDSTSTNVEKFKFKTQVQNIEEKTLND